MVKEKGDTFSLKFKTTADLKVDKNIVDQVVGQEAAVNVIKKAAAQHRHVLLIGEPGTGKSMLGLALAQLLPKEKLVDIMAFANPNDENKPLIRAVPSGQGRTLIEKSKATGSVSFRNQNILMFILLIAAMVTPWWARHYYTLESGAIVGAIMFASFFLGGMVFLALFVLVMNVGKQMGGRVKTSSPKLIVDNYSQKQAPFFDATGSHAGALLGDVLHDPFQSGGLGTPAHERVVSGMIHKANQGVLFIDEISTLQPHTQQELLSAIQERKFAITGQSERSAGAMVRTEAAPCDFVLIAAGNFETIEHMHPALRSRIRGYGYEVHMSETMKDTQSNRDKLANFIAQEIKKDGKIPAFSRAACERVVIEAKKRANRKGHLTLRLRELGGIVRAAGDLALEQKTKLVEPKHIEGALILARSLEQQIADKYIERKKEYNVISTTGTQVGRVNGLAVMGAGSMMSGIILAIEAQCTPGGKESTVVATGKLGEIAKEAIINVSAVIKKIFAEDIKGNHELFVQFLQTYEGVEGDSASIAVAVAIISALKQLPVKQSIAMTGSLSVRGKALPVGGVSAKVEAAIDTGMKEVIVPKSNLNDIVISKEKLKRIKVIPVDNIVDVLINVIDWKGNKKVLDLIKKNY